MTINPITRPSQNFFSLEMVSRHRITSIPALGRVIEMIVWLFQKIFPCCFRDIKPLVIPTPTLAIASIRKSIPINIVPMNFEKILKMPKELQEILVKSFSRDDLDAFDLALSSCKSTNSNRLHVLIKQARTKEILRNILVDHPNWQKEVDAWKGVSIEDKVWLLQLYELHQLPSIKINQISDLYPNAALHTPSIRTPELLIARNEIEKYLSTIKFVNINDNPNFIKCPEAICLLKNLQYLDIIGCRLLVPPDVRWNANLARLCCNSNVLERAPDVRWNLKLQELDLSGNRLAIPPNVTRNPALQRLTLYTNQLSEAPNVSNNEQLTVLELVNNRLKLPPDLSKNLKLRVLTIGKNHLEVLPDLSRNASLERLFANENKLTHLADLIWHPNLKTLNISRNPIKTLPDLSQNVNLEILEANGCALTCLPSLVHNSKLTELSLNSNQLTSFPELSPKHSLDKITISMQANPLSDDAKRKMLGHNNFLF